MITTMYLALTLCQAPYLAFHVYVQPNIYKAPFYLLAPQVLGIIVPDTTPDHAVLTTQCGTWTAKQAALIQLTCV